MFDAVFIQYCVANNINIPNGMAMDIIDKQSHLDKFSTNEPAKFNKLCNDKDITIKSLIEVLISRGEFIRAIHNQNITTPDGEFIGANVKEAVTWFKNPTNSALVSAYKNNLKTFDYEHWGDARDVQRTGTTDGYADRSCYSHGRYRYLS